MYAYRRLQTVQRRWWSIGQTVWWQLLNMNVLRCLSKWQARRHSHSKIGRRVLHDTCYIAHQFEGQRSISQAHIVCISHLCLFFIRETKCCTCVITGERGHTVSAEPGVHAACFAESRVWSYSLIGPWSGWLTTVLQCYMTLLVRLPGP